MTLFITKNPQVDAGADLDLCENSGSIVIDDAIVSHYDTLLWTSSGTAGTLTNEDLPEVTYSPSAADIAQGQVTLTLTGSRAANNCGSQAIDVKVISFFDLPTASAGPPATICDAGTYFLEDATANNYSTVVWTHDGLGRFENPNILKPTYIDRKSVV